MKYIWSSYSTADRKKDLWKSGFGNQATKNYSFSSKNLISTFEVIMPFFYESIVKWLSPFLKPVRLSVRIAMVELF